ncbi:hypothetical protein HELRODRAFT_181067 [Helobdella robusta]|uniref:Protein tweety homolog n=1 Tax=Helobdella robusta TaxID=6412 RepID=T1FGK6_HELRO|nr:hypothetical protein HELRODRAFT_181067 [Helobdella robusta]ESN93317.1 hypothetical protein HELRODRAFT_181067 [Helobdella robusta]
MEVIEVSGEDGGMYIENGDSFLIHFLHSFPRIDFSLTVVNSTFDLESTKYKESLLFWASLPVLGLLIVLISLLAYLIFRCICKSAYDDESTNRSRISESECEKTNKCISCVKWSISCLVLLACGSSAFGFYGNNEIRKGSNIVSDAIASTAINLYYAQTQVSQLRNLINSTNAEIKSLRETLKRHFGQYRHLNTTANEELGKHLELMSRRMTEVWNHVRDLVDRDEKRDETDSKVAIYSKLFEDFDLYRWITCISIFVWLIVLSLMLLLGAVKSSKCLLLVLILIGAIFKFTTFQILYMWYSNSCGLLVVMQLTSRINSSFTEYYIKCNPTKHPNPLVHHIKGAQNGVSEMNSNINEAANYIKNFLPQSEYTSGSICRQYSGLLNLSENCSTMRESIA